MKLYWFVELDAARTALRTLAVVGEDNGRRSYQLLADTTAVSDSDTADEAVVLVDVDVVVPWKGRRLGLIPVASPPLTDDLEEAVTFLAERVAATMRQAS